MTGSKHLILSENLNIIMTKMKKDNISAIAGQTALFMFLSVIPFLLFFFSIIQYLPISIESVETILIYLLPDYLQQATGAILNEIYTKSVNITILSIIITVFTAAQGFHSLSNGLNVIYDIEDNQNWFLSRIRAMGYTFLFFIDVILMFFLFIFGRYINEILEANLYQLPLILTVFYYLRFVILYILLVLYFTYVYYLFPDRRIRKNKIFTFKNQLPGAIFSISTWYILAFILQIYEVNFYEFSVYGSLTRIIVIIIYLYFCVFMLMLGAELNAIYYEAINGFMEKNPVFKRIMAIKKVKIKVDK